MKRILVGLAILFAALGLLSVGLIFVFLFSPQSLGITQSINVDTFESLTNYSRGLPTIFFTIATLMLVFLSYHRQREDAKRNQTAVARQVFDSTFFTMLSTLHELRSDVRSTHTREGGEEVATLSGNAFFKEFVEQLKEKFYARQHDGKYLYNNAIEAEERLKTLSSEIQRLEIGQLRSGLTEAFMDTLEAYDTQMGNYLRFLTSVLVFIKDSQIGEKERYAAMIQNQLSGYELSLIFYAGLAEYRPKGAEPKMLYEIIQDYGMVDTIQPVHLLDVSHALLYPEVAFRFLKNAQLKLRDDLYQTGVLGFLQKGVVQS